ncbi:uncharacterized protein B0H64DRAFT_133866 [Chaetomium fimeti]|uniref:Uncharacterized protein n=1 Tax=Chaetomium fimeti TaxID=1854472 RepID=A0AAE0LU57_9PEZI|nr:hypothetical protein B0H64DRAFT_133866 [Chaetomium fimeti]
MLVKQVLVWSCSCVPEMKIAPPWVSNTTGLPLCERGRLGSMTDLSIGAAVQCNLLTLVVLREGAEHEPRVTRHYIDGAAASNVNYRVRSTVRSASQAYPRQLKASERKCCGICLVAGILNPAPPSSSEGFRRQHPSIPSKSGCLGNEGQASETGSCSVTPRLGPGVLQLETARARCQELHPSRSTHVWPSSQAKVWCGWVPGNGQETANCVVCIAGSAY